MRQRLRMGEAARPALQKRPLSSPARSAGQPMLSRALQRALGNLTLRRLLQRPSRLRAAGLRSALSAPGGLRIFRDLARELPGRRAEPVPLAEAEVDAAIAFNTARYSTSSVREIQDIVGAPVTGVVDEETVHMIVEMQADARLAPDGKVGLQTLRVIVLEMIAAGRRNAPILLIIDGHNLSMAGLASIRFDATVTGDNALTSGPIPGNSTVRIGPPAFTQGYEGLVHTIAHELEHVRQRRAGIANQDEREFLAEAIEIMSVGMLQENFAGLMDDAGRALIRFNNLPAADQARLHGRFVQVRAQVRRRFDATPAAARTAAHQATMTGLDAVP